MPAAADPPRVAHLVVPAEVDDPAAPSGGNVYDVELARGLAAAGWELHRHRVPAGGPAAARTGGLASCLAALPAGSVVLVDGLLTVGAEDVVVGEAPRLRIVPLLHLPRSLAGGGPGVVDDERRMLGAAAAVLTTSEWARRWLGERHPGLDTPVHAAAPGVHGSSLAPQSPAGRSLACVAAVVPAKGQDVLVRALARVRDLDWTCRLVGPLGRDPGFVGEVVRLVHEHDLDGRVRLTGAMPRAAVGAVLDASDLLVHPTLREVYGMVTTEALARGVPVMASDVGGVPEALGRAPSGAVPGLLVPPADPDALADALRSWLTDAPLRDRLRRAALERRDGLGGWAATAAAVADVLRETAPRPPVNRTTPAAVVSG
ncbi:glycosyltransferase family 4 protein [Phycicoccus avicenniae]|uniref:glycosyltransferase family 4 protein n=1 Tax=Phycicoccus avicenniae TaxID=2828860 RepID=UPI003D2D098E